MILLVDLLSRSWLLRSMGSGCHKAPNGVRIIDDVFFIFFLVGLSVGGWEERLLDYVACFVNLNVDLSLGNGFAFLLCDAVSLSLCPRPPSFIHRITHPLF